MEIYINPDYLENYIKSYKEENVSFLFENYIPIPGKSECLCNFFINGKACKIRFYIKTKTNSVKMMPIGNNAEESKELIDFIANKGHKINDAVHQQNVFPCDKKTIENLIKYINEEFNDEINIQYIKDNKTRFIGFNKDFIDIIFYESTNKAVLQGRPFTTYGIIMAYLSQIPLLSLDNIVHMNNIFGNIKISSENIREIMQKDLDAAYNYLDKALLKSLSGSLASLEALKKNNCEDYTGCTVGAFKTLEGYLIKILSNKYNYLFKNRDKFKMFYKKNGKYTLIDINKNIGKDEKKELNDLYSIYSNKRNVFLHSTIDPSQTRIIENWEEANDIVNQIVNKIESSYKIFYS